MRKKIAVAGIASLALTGAAQAADIVEPVAYYDWTGPYIGLQAGYAWDETPVNWERSAGLDDPVDIDSIDPDGFVGGLHAGYLFQEDSLVFGLEADIEYSDLSGSTDFIVFDPGPEDLADIDYDIDWLGSLRLRLGFAMDRALVYATGGLAVGAVKLEGDAEAPGLADESDDATKWGWTAGVGAAYALADDLSARLEYRYTDLGTSEIRFSSQGEFVDAEVRNDFHAVRAGLSWRFPP